MPSNPGLSEQELPLPLREFMEECSSWSRERQGRAMQECRVNMYHASWRQGRSDGQDEQAKVEAEAEAEGGKELATQPGESTSSSHNTGQPCDGSPGSQVQPCRYRTALPFLPSELPWLLFLAVLTVLIAVVFPTVVSGGSG